MQGMARAQDGYLRDLTIRVHGRPDLFDILNYQVDRYIAGIADRTCVKVTVDSIYTNSSMRLRVQG
jgi:hypothetical protein